MSQKKYRFNLLIIKWLKSVFLEGVKCRPKVANKICNAQIACYTFAKKND